MNQWLHRTALILAAVLTIAGCDTALTVGGRTVGFRSGEFIYTDGYLRATYHFTLDEVWRACERTLADLKATQVERIRKIAQGSFAALIDDEKLMISIDYVEKGITAVSIRVGLAGNNIAAQMVHDRLTATLRAR